MGLTWSPEAEKALNRVPFFVRKRVRQRLEAEARQTPLVDRGSEHFMEHYRPGQRFGDILPQKDYFFIGAVDLREKFNI